MFGLEFCDQRPLAGAPAQWLVVHGGVCDQRKGSRAERPGDGGQWVGQPRIGSGDGSRMALGGRKAGIVSDASERAGKRRSSAYRDIERSALKRKHSGR